MTQLLIVESPAKARTIASLLGAGWRVSASMGHVRDLPQKEFGVSRETFAPEYVPTTRGKEVLSRLRAQVKTASHVYLATDPDREGEAIAWHLAEALHLPKGKTSRVAYHEITETAIRKALASPRDIDLHLVDAQQARRVLDRVVGYTVSPKLWAQAKGLGLSAGRVQTPTLRLVVERDRAIADFKTTHHYGAELDIAHALPFTATWDTTAYRKSEDEPYVLDRSVAESAASVRAVTVKTCLDGTRRVNPRPPFTTSALQQAASAKLDFSPEYTMQLAQALFERHHAISYHRTDSVVLSTEAIDAIRSYARTKGYPLPGKPIQHTGKSKNAQEAHEAIRPTDVTAEQPQGVTGDALALYKLIHRQAVASQLAPLVLATRKIVLVNVAQDRPALAQGAFTYEAKGQTVTEPGFTVLTGAPTETRLPSIATGTKLHVEDGRVLEQQTQPPARYTEGSLIADLERRGIGRPSTWAAILSNIKTRGYITVKGKKVFSTPVGSALVDALADMRFASYDYTARLEKALDRIAAGEVGYTAVVRKGWADLDEDIAGKMHPMHVPDVAVAAARPPKPSSRSKAAPKSATQRKTGTRSTKSSGAKSAGTRSTGTKFAGTKSAGTKSAGTKSDGKTQKCPECGAAMKKRSSARGEFYGCSAYPDCRGTRPA